MPSQTHAIDADLRAAYATLTPPQRLAFDAILDESQRASFKAIDDAYAASVAEAAAKAGLPRRGTNHTHPPREGSPCSGCGV